MSSYKYNEGDYIGPNHDNEPIDFFGGQQGFKSLVERDKIKLNYCLQHRLYMIYCKYTETEEEIKTKILSAVKERG